MNYLLLRGQVPQDRNPQEIVFNTLDEMDDVWTLLFHELLDINDYGEVWYWGGKRKHHFTDNFVERWIPNFRNYNSSFVPDVIFCRGGFPQYHHILNKFPKAYKIYYGAGKRYIPPIEYRKYDLILQDSPAQLAKCRKVCKSTPSILFIKPASDNLFYPLDVKKKYDVCFPANGSQARLKGHFFVFSTAPKDLKILNLGNRSDVFIPNNITSKRVIKSQMNKHMQQCKIGIVTCEGKVDSCPRVIPEMLAAGLPILVLDSTRFWADKYITKQTGGVSPKSKFWKNVRYLLDNISDYSPRPYYEKHLSLSVAGKFLKTKILL